MCSLHHSASDQVQKGRIFVKDIVFERTFSAQNNAIPAIAGVIRNVRCFCFFTLSYIFVEIFVGGFFWHFQN